MKEDLDRNCLTRKVRIEKIGNQEPIYFSLKRFVSPGISALELDINIMPYPTQIGSEYNFSRLGISAEYFGNTKSRSSAGLEHRLDKAGVVGSNPTETTFDTNYLDFTKFFGNVI